MKEDMESLYRIKRDVLYGRDIAPPRVNEEECNGCGQCFWVCPVLVFELREKKATVLHGERCNACGHCWVPCPESAVIQDDVATVTDLKPGQMPAVSPDRLQLLIRERRSTRLITDRLATREQLLQIIKECLLSVALRGGSDHRTRRVG